MIKTIVELSAGNPGAVSVLIGLVKTDAAASRLARLRALDIKGSAIWVLFKDSCGSNGDRLGSLLDANARGQVTDDEVRALADEDAPALGSRSAEVEALLARGAA